MAFDKLHNPQVAEAFTVYNVTLAANNTQYSQALPSMTTILEFQNRGAHDIRYAFVTGKVAASTAPYMTLKSGGYFYRDNLLLVGVTLYIATGDGASDVVEIMAGV